MNKFNLIDEPWIPIVGVGLVSLKQIFSESHFTEIGGNPVQKIALMKFFLAIAQAAYTPVDNEEWESLGSDTLASKCIAYLDKWRDAFWLYGDKPFLQILDLETAEKKSLGALMPEVACGNTTLLTQWQIQRVYTDAGKALLLLTLMGFGLSGKTDNKFSLSNLNRNKVKRTPGAFLGQYGYIHNFVTVNNICKDIWFNLLTNEQICNIGFSKIGTPPWEIMPRGEDCSVAHALQRDLMGRLIPMSMFCLISENDMHYSKGISYLNHSEGGIDPSTAIDRSKKDPKAAWVDPSKRLWRWLTSFLGFLAQNNNYSFDCILIRIGMTRARKNSAIIGIWSGGLKVSCNGDKQYISGVDDFIESKILLQSTWLQNGIWFEKLKYEMEALNELSKNVSKATSTYYKDQKLIAKGQVNNATSIFWQACEKDFIKLLEACGSQDESRKSLRQNFFNFACDAFDRCCPKGTARQLDSWAKNRPRPGKYLNVIN